MKTLHPYLIFNGNCREAMDFYAQVFGDKNPYFTTFENTPSSTPATKHLIMHARVMLPNGASLLASDSGQSHPPTVGDNVFLCIEPDSNEEQDSLFQKLSTGGNVIVPVQDMFWGARFGMFVDKFGIRWMLNLQKTPA